MMPTLGILTILYPLIVYLGFRSGHHSVAVGVVIAAFALRGYSIARRYSPHRSLMPYLVAVGIVTGAGLTNASFVRAPLFLPTVINGSLCLLFALSFATPRNAVERIATLMEGPLPREARGYCAKVCTMWVIFFALNAGISFDSAFRSLEWWSLYNGIISYLLIGSLMGGEYLIRRQFKRRLSAAIQAMVCIVLSSYLSAPGIAQTPSSIPPHIQKHLSPPAAFRTDFTEKRFISVLSQPLESRGTMRCIPGSGLIWETTTPIARTSIITPHALVEITGDRIVDATVDATQISQTMLSLMSGSLQSVEQHFALSVDSQSAHWELRLAPLDNLVRDVISAIVVRGVTRPEQLEVIHASGDRVITSFSSPEILTSSELAGAMDALKRAS